MSDTEDRKILRQAYDVLRTTDNLLQDVQRGISRLVTVKERFLPDTSESLGREKNSRDRAFRGEDRDNWYDWYNGWIRRTGSRFFEVDSNDYYTFSEGKLDRELENLRVRRKYYEDVSSVVRLTAENISRPFVRRLRVWDLPGEILSKIFEFVESFDERFMDYPWDEGRRDIQNCRLTCRLFCSVSSSMLIRLLLVRCEDSSVSRLEEISRHPIISKGVRAVRVVLHSYNPTLYEHIEEFIHYHIENLAEQVHMFEATRRWEWEKIPEEVALEKLRKAKVVLDSWRRITSSAEKAHEIDSVHRGLVERTHEQYRRLYEEQESMGSHGKFANIVGRAMARMPCARKLDFNDTEFLMMRGDVFNAPGGDICDAIYKEMLKPATGYSAKIHGLEQMPYHVVTEVPVAVRSAGVWLNDIDIKLSFVGGSQQLVTDLEAREKVSAAMQQVKTFSFKCSDSLDERDSDNLNKFLETCLDTPSLKKLKLDLRIDGEAEEWHVDIAGRFIASRPWRNLTDISIFQVSVDLSDLVSFLQSLPPSIECLWITDMHLRSGTWAEALEVLREKSYKIVHITSPRGAECDDLSQEELENVFGKPNHNFSSAEQYIRKLRYMTNNPLQSLKNRVE
ncbi:hypothetical protein V490_03443 [Pseudogymnoascus sp. VKM F-3557]|nr:hypothetical protein V490_03443 [Pseudogymnoascus sp. VKM F-3557]